MAKGIKRSLPEITHDEIVTRELADAYVPNEDTRYVVILEVWETWGCGCAGIAYIGYPVMFQTIKDSIEYVDKQVELVRQEYRDANYEEKEIEDYLSERETGIHVAYKGKMVWRYGKSIATPEGERYKYCVYPTSYN